jgi:hypothetical protein
MARTCFCNRGRRQILVDEILFHSEIHPEARCHTLSDEQIEALYNNTEYVCRTAVEVEADSSRFPAHWLFKHRWVRVTHLCTNLAHANCVLGERKRQADWRGYIDTGRSCLATSHVNRPLSRNQARKPPSNGSPSEGEHQRWFRKSRNSQVPKRNDLGQSFSVF